ncbi:Enoyl reductase OS=Streptomyces alboniger OX=132473 GN=CP975_24835 PE=4 SV=1 [Streptomyces alboniger]
MPAMTYRPVALMAAAAMTGVALSASPAAAEKGIGGGTGAAPPPQVSGGREGGSLVASAGGISYDDDGKNGSGPNTGTLAPTGDYTPPPCWYGPAYTPAQFKKEREAVWAAESTGYQWDAEQRKRYVEGEPYKDFNLDKAGKGYWWHGYANPDFPPGWDKCDKETFWVDENEPPPPGLPAIDAETLAKLAYARIRVPGTKVSLAPEAETKVNLPTWAWLDGAEFKPVSVTARVQVLGIHATTTAEPVALKIDPGTADAETYPADGVCEIVDGRIGQPYAKGRSKEDPPCGVKYLRSSGDGSYPLKATVTWKIHWTGTGVDGEQELPDGEFGAEQDVVVEEIQAINR